MEQEKGASKSRGGWGGGGRAEESGGGVAVKVPGLESRLPGVGWGGHNLP